MTHELTVAASGACAFIEFAVSRGASRQALVQRSGIDPAVLQDRDNRVPFSAYVALMRVGQELCKDPALALHFGEAVDCSEIAVPVGGAMNLDDALTVGNRYVRLAVEVESVGTAENLIRPILHEKVVTVDMIAGQLGLSRQTLFRRLSAEGVTFQQVLDQLRHKLAVHYLISDKTSVQRAARLVGFSDSTAFSRAFKRWTGIRPRAYVARNVPPA